MFQTNLTMHLRPRPLFFLLFCLPLLLVGQTDSLPAFPQDFVGNWAGELEIFGPDGKRQGVPMELLIQPLSDTSYTYTIIYGEDKVAGKRDYLIVRGADGPHHWVCDEQNTIFLDGYYLGGTYHSKFTVMGNWLVSTLEHRGDHLVYAISSGKTEAARVSGDQTHEGEEIPAVESFKTAGFQRAILRPQK
ncbi:MAG: hypothetical protein AAFZ52_14105 [Bacteroidota bacterium]